MSFFKPPEKKPTRKQNKLYQQWLKYLRNSKLDLADVHGRAEQYAMANRKVPKD